jgi:hypothetical protein
MTAGSLGWWILPAGSAGSGTPASTSPVTGPGDLSRPLERDRRVDPFPLQQRPFSLLDHHPVLQGDLELAGQAALGPGGHRLAEQVGHHPGTSLQDTDLALVPAALTSVSPWSSAAAREGHAPVQVDLVEGADGLGQRSGLDPHAVPSTLASR